VLNLNNNKVHIQNDEARSIILNRVRAGTIIELYEDQDLSKKKDWVRITINKLKDKIVIGSFEKNSDKTETDYNVTYYKKGLFKNLDGKVSAVTIPLLNYHVIAPSKENFSEKFRQDNPGLSIFLEAERIVANIEDTAYSHTTNVDDDAGRYMLDCSGLLDYILNKSLPLTDHYAGMLALAIQDGKKRPLAETVYDYLSGEKHEGWHEIKDFRHVKPGDIIVEKYSDTPSSGSTGHVMIIAGWGKKLSNKTCNNSTCFEYLIPVIESARGTLDYDSRNYGVYNVSPATSTRYIGKNRTGVGKGFLRFHINQEGEVICHKRKKTSDLDCSGHYVIGRAVPFKKNI
jgi:hypothetical protein